VRSDRAGILGPVSHDAGPAADWASYWRSPGEPLEAMHAHFRGHVYHRHSHDCYSFGVTESGAQGFSCRGARHVSTTGMVMAFNPDDPHDGHAVAGPGFTYRMIHVGPDFLAELVADVTGRPPGRLLSTGAANAARKIRAFLHDEYAGPVTGADLAAITGRSRYAAYRAFQASYGLAPSAYQRQLRLRAARRLLAHGTAPADAAAQAGFADQAHLTRWFRRCYGITPGAYRGAASR
jgi:AraC-like DNA-binding protein